MTVQKLAKRGHSA